MRTRSDRVTVRVRSPLKHFETTRSTEKSQLLLIFDIDGTLFQGHRATVPAVREAFEQFGLARPSEDEIVRSIGTSMYDYHSWLAERCGEVDAEALIAEADRLELIHIRESAVLYPGALEMLGELKDGGHFIATATYAPRDYFDAVLDAHGLRTYVDLPLCKGDGFTSKTAMVAHAMVKFPERPAVVIGDRRDDVEAAHANGAYAIGAAYGYGADGELDEADAVIHSLASLTSVLPKQK